MIRLIIKGNKNDASQAASRHWVICKTMIESEKNIILADVDECFTSEVIKWFCSDLYSKSSFPNGSLLYYRLPEKDT